MVLNCLQFLKLGFIVFQDKLLFTLYRISSLCSILQNIEYTRQQGGELVKSTGQDWLPIRRADETRRHGEQHSQPGPLELRHPTPASRLCAVHRCQKESGANQPSPQRANSRRASSERILLRACAKGHSRVCALFWLIS